MITCFTVYNDRLDFVVVGGWWVNFDQTKIQKVSSIIFCESWMKLQCLNFIDVKVFDSFKKLRAVCLVYCLFCYWPV